MQEMRIKAIKLNNLTIRNTLVIKNGIEIPWIGGGVYRSTPSDVTR
ncbi:MAG: hypothetical protein ACFFB5_08615 [Promethearchaeota archaeon]